MHCPTTPMSRLNELVNETLHCNYNAITNPKLDNRSRDVDCLHFIMSCRLTVNMSRDMLSWCAHISKFCRNSSPLTPNIMITFVITRHYTYRIDHGERERMCIIKASRTCFRSLFFFKLRAFLKLIP